MLVFFPFIRPFLCFSFLLSFPLFSVWFVIVLPFFPLLFHFCFVSIFRFLWVSSLAHPNLLETKRLGCCC
jgi:hypothetical protein